jgi:dihydroneopterin aldolase
MIKVELYGLEVFGYHGVLEEERREGQTFLFDVEIEVSDAALSDRIEAAVDYRDVVARVEQVSARRKFQLLEALAAATADAIVADLAVQAARVRVRKRPPTLAVEWTAATAERRKG